MEKCELCGQRWACLETVALEGGDILRAQGCLECFEGLGEIPGGIAERLPEDDVRGVCYLPRGAAPRVLSRTLKRELKVEKERQDLRAGWQNSWKWAVRRRRWWVAGVGLRAQQTGGVA
jgi:hypothetical protein